MDTTYMGREKALDAAATSVSNAAQALTNVLRGPYGNASNDSENMAHYIIDKGLEDDDELVYARNHYGFAGLSLFEIKIIVAVYKQREALLEMMRTMDGASEVLGCMTFETIHRDEGKD